MWWNTADESMVKKIINEEGRAELSSDIHALSYWTFKDKMQLHEGKFKLKHFGRKNIIISHTCHTLFLSGQLLTASNIKDLRVVVDNNLSWSSHVSNKVDIGRQMCSWILKTFWSKEQGHNTNADAHPPLSTHIKQNISSLESSRSTFT